MKQGMTERSTKPNDDLLDWSEDELNEGDFDDAIKRKSTIGGVASDVAVCDEASSRWKVAIEEGGRGRGQSL